MGLKNTRRIHTKKKKTVKIAFKDKERQETSKTDYKTYL